MEKKKTLWRPGGINAKPNKEEQAFLDAHPDWEIRFTALYRCGMLNYLEGCEEAETVE